MADVIAPTAERALRDRVDRVEAAGVGTLHHVVASTLLLDCLVLTAAAREAGLLLREAYMWAGHRGRCALPTRTGRAEMSSAMAEAGRLYRDAIRAVQADRRVVVIAVCCDDSDRQGVEGLHEGLMEVARYWDGLHRAANQAADDEPPRMLARFLRRLQDEA